MLDIRPPTGFLLGSWFWSWSWNWGWNGFNWSGFTLGNTAATFLDKFNGVGSGAAILTHDGDGSLNGLGGRATVTLLLHLAVLANGGTDALTTAHVHLEVSLSLTEHTIDLNRNSTDKIGAHSATTDTLFDWLVAFLNTTVFGGVDVFFWALLEEDLSSGEALSVDVSFTLLASALDAHILAGSPRVTNLSFLVVLVGTTEWHAHAAALSRVGNSDMAHWTVTAAFSVTDWHVESLHIWSTWARASGASVANWSPELSWLIGLSFELAEVEWLTSSLNVTWTSAEHWGIHGSSTVWAVLKWWLNTADALDGIWAAFAFVSVRDWGGNVTVSTWHSIGHWAIGGITDTLVVIAASWGGWVVGSDKNWSRATISTHGWRWNWAVFWVADAFLLEDWSTAVAESLDVDLTGGDHLKTSWADSLLIVEWTLASVATARVLWTTLVFNLAQNTASTVASWGWWTELWNFADLVVTAAALVIIAVDVYRDLVLLNEATEIGGAVFNDRWSAVFWVTDTLELWATVGFGGSFLAVSSGGADLNSDLLTSQAVGRFVSLSSLGTEGAVADASLTAATRVSSLMESFVLVADWIDVVKWARLDSALASSNWTAVVLVVSIVAQGFDFTELAFSASWSFWAVLRNLFSALDWFAPFLSTTSSGIGT